ncbi:MAG: hypothetical protein ACREK8_05270 [Gemmatimonadales bacterium]
MPSAARLWFGLTAAPAAWSIAEVAGYALAGRHCALDQPSVAMGSLAVLIATMVLGAAGWAAAVTNVRDVRRASRSTRETPANHPAVESTTPIGRARFMAVSGLLASSLFLAGIALFVLATLTVRVCERVR